MERPRDLRRSKQKYFIILHGEHVGESWAVSPQKAVTNWWWKNIKGESSYSPREYSPSDFDAIEAR